MSCVGEPPAAFLRTSPMNTTIFPAVTSSMHGTIVVGSGSLFYSNKPFKVCWRIYLFVSSGSETLLDILRTLCPYVAPSKPVLKYLRAIHRSLRTPISLWNSE
jgi:hypothetical protein